MKKFSIAGLALALSILVAPAFAHAQERCQQLVIKDPTNAGNNVDGTLCLKTPKAARQTAVVQTTDDPADTAPRNDFRSAGQQTTSDVDLSGVPGALRLPGSDPLMGARYIPASEAAAILRSKGMSPAQARGRLLQITEGNNRLCSRVEKQRKRHKMWGIVRPLAKIAQTAWAVSEWGSGYGLGVVGLSTLFGEVDAQLHDQDTYMWLDDDQAFCEGFIDWKTENTTWKRNVGDSLMDAH